MASYTHQVLCAEGTFRDIWKAAHKVTKLTRREVANINISQSCEELLEYIERRKPIHNRPHARHKPLSLYFSTYLMYGIIRIFDKQCDYLLADARAAYVVKLAVTDKLIDLPAAQSEDRVTIPEILNSFCLDLEELDIPIPLSGETAGSQERASRRQQNGTSLSPDVSRAAPRSKSRKRKKPESDDVVTVASAEQITMVEAPTILVDTPLSPIPVPKDLELPSMTGQEIDFTLGPNDEPPLAVRDLLPASTPIGARTPDRSARTRQGAQQTMLLESPSVQMQQKTPEHLPQPQEMPQTPTRVAPPSPNVTRQEPASPRQRRPPKPRKSLTLAPLDAGAINPVRRTYRRNLRFIDPSTQISRAQIKINILSSKNTSVEFNRADTHRIDPTDKTNWLNIPGREVLRGPPLHRLWSRGARFRRDLPLDQCGSSAEESSGTEGPRLSQGEIFTAVRLPIVDPDRSLAEEIAQQEVRPAEESIEIPRQHSATAEGLDISAVEMPSIEIARDASTSRIEPGMPNISDIQQVDESNKSDTSASSKRRSRSVSSQRGSTEGLLEPQPSLSTTSLQTSSMGLGGLYNIVEEEPGVEVLPIRLHVTHEMGEGGEHRDEDFLRILNEELAHQTSKKTTFKKLCPTLQATRKQAARMFFELLSLCSKGKVLVRQEISFGDIYIWKA